MVKSNKMRKTSSVSRRTYRRRVKASACRGKKRKTCRIKKSCKYISGKKRKFCRKTNNRRLLCAGKARRTKRGGHNWIVPAALLGLNKAVKNKHLKKLGLNKTVKKLTKAIKIKQLKKLRLK